MRRIVVPVFALLLLCAGATPSFARGSRISVGGSVGIGWRSPRSVGNVYVGRNHWGGSISVGSPWRRRSSFTFGYQSWGYPTYLYSPYSSWPFYDSYSYWGGWPSYYPYYLSPIVVQQPVVVDRPVYVPSQPSVVVINRSRDDDYVYEWRSDARKSRDAARRSTAPSVPGRPSDQLRFQTRAGGSLQVTWTGAEEGLEAITFVLLDRDSRTLDRDEVTAAPFTTVFTRTTGAVAVRATLRYSDGVRQTLAVPLPAQPAAATGDDPPAPAPRTLVSADPYALYR